MRIKAARSDDEVAQLVLAQTFSVQLFDSGDGGKCVSLPRTGQPVRGDDPEALWPRGSRESRVHRSQTSSRLRPALAVRVGTKESAGRDGDLPTSRHGRLSRRRRDTHWKQAGEWARLHATWWFKFPAKCARTPSVAQVSECCVATAGFSVGEITALTFAEALTTEAGEQELIIHCFEQPIKIPIVPY